MLVLLTTRQIVYSQTDSCQIKVSVDSYTGKKIIESGFVDFDGGTYLLSKDEGKIILWLSFYSDNFYIIPKGDIIYLKLSDDSVIKFMIPSTNYADYSQYTNKYSNSFAFFLTGNKLEQLKTKSIVGAKCYINEYIIDDSIGLLFKRQLKCIIKK